MIQPERIQFLNEKKIRAEKPYVLYWMQASQRAEWNHALEYGIDRANELEKPLVVLFCVTDAFPEANERHYAFMLEGLKETKERLERRGIQMKIRYVAPDEGAIELAKEACLVVVDRGYLRIEKQWRNQVAEKAQCQMVQVESNVIVPVETASPKGEYSAGTLRKKLNARLADFAVPLRLGTLGCPSLNLSVEGEDFSIEDVEAALGNLKIDRSVMVTKFFRGGVREAYAHLNDFVENKLAKYGEKHSEPSGDFSSHLSPYLHFGQISPLAIFEALGPIPFDQKKEFLEELIVRRELSMNFVYYSKNYDSYECLPEWTQKTLGLH